MFLEDRLIGIVEDYAKSHQNERDYKKCFGDLVLLLYQESIKEVFSDGVKDRDRNPKFVLNNLKRIYSVWDSASKKMQHTAWGLTLQRDNFKELFEILVLNRTTERERRFFEGIENCWK